MESPSPKPSHVDGKATVAVPIKLGFSLKDYYELDDTDNKFGFFSVGGLATVPLGSHFNVHGGLEFQALGDLEDVTDVVQALTAKYGEPCAEAKNFCVFDGKWFAIPYHFIGIGSFLRKDWMQDKGITPKDGYTWAAGAAKSDTDAR